VPVPGLTTTYLTPDFVVCAVAGAASSVGIAGAALTVATSTSNTSVSASFGIGPLYAIAGGIHSIAFSPCRMSGMPSRKPAADVVRLSGIGWPRPKLEKNVSPLFWRQPV
jgi:hypothetical protein